MKKRLLGLVAIPLIAIGSLTYANDFIVPDTENGTITVYSQDYSYGITIQDKNLGAENVGDYGYYYQWGNNHGNYVGTNTGNLNELLDADVNERVNKGYSGENDKFIIFNNGNKNTYDYRSGVYYTNATYNSYVGDSAYNNLRGGGNDNDDSDATIVKGYDTVNHVVTNPDNRQGPCPDGYHVPSAGEWQELMMLWCNANPDICSGSVINTQNGEYARANYLSKSGIGTAFSNDLELPLAGFRSYYGGAVYGQGDYAYYRSSSPRGGSYPKRAWRLNFNPNDVNPSSNDNRANGQSLRCFKNSYVKLPKTLNLFFMSDGEEVGTGEITENMTGAIPEEAKNVTKTGYELLYWSLSGADPVVEFDFETTPISGAWADENDNVYFIAQWTGIKYSVEFTGTDIEGTMPNQEFTYGIAQNLTANAFTKNGYTFSGWTDGTTGYTDGQEVNNLTTTNGKVITLTAEWTKNKTSGGSSGGGGMKKDNCPNGDLSPSYYDGMCEENNSGEGSGSVSSGTDVKDLEGDKQDFYPTSGASDKSSEGQTELEQAYQFAFKNSITTMNTIDKANIDGHIKRGHLAKMVVNYVTNVLGKEIPSDIPASCLSFSDETTARESAEIKDYAIKSCALGLMGIRMKNNEFLPNDYVTRAEFGTVLSRVLWGDRYNLVGSKEKPRYSAHLNALKEEGIMKMIDNPKMLEKRGYVMIMLMRSAK